MTELLILETALVEAEMVVAAEAQEQVVDPILLDNQYLVRAIKEEFIRQLEAEEAEAAEEQEPVEETEEKILQIKTEMVELV
jgi:hypothetical protein